MFVGKAGQQRTQRGPMKPNTKALEKFHKNKGWLCWYYPWAVACFRWAEPGVAPGLRDQVLWNPGRQSPGLQKPPLQKPISRKNHEKRDLLDSINMYISTHGILEFSSKTFRNDDFTTQSCTSTMLWLTILPHQHCP